MGARLDSAWSLFDQVIQEANEAVCASLRNQLHSTPFDTRRVSQLMVREFEERGWLAPEEEYSVNSELRDGDRSLHVTVTVKNPRPSTAAAFLAAGGKWV